MFKKVSFNIQIPGYTVAVIEFGDPNGTPVVALHGWLDNAASFYCLAKNLKGIRLIAIDLIGHGRSDHRPDVMPYYIWDNVTDLCAVLDALSIKKVSLIGHSMGASIAMLFAGAFPERVERLMLIEGLAPLFYEEEYLPQLFADAVIKRSKMVAKTLRPYACYEDAIQARINGRWPVSREAAEALLERGLSKTERGYIWSNDPKLMMPSLVRFSFSQISSFIKSVKSEAIVIRGSSGAADSIINPWLGDFFHAEVIDMEGGHHLHLEPHPAKLLAERINQWA
ncbi:alpha/beta fold hydrolase [Neptuniibacter sp. QD72_48]|uniref:alpha/beta fold hydrolase n=1 Tax=unclassified Neptuniibacter TaxID=2630693 RepID=UPI0039F5FE59